MKMFRVIQKVKRFEDGQYLIMASFLHLCKLLKWNTGVGTYIPSWDHCYLFLQIAVGSCDRKRFPIRK